MGDNSLSSHSKTFALAAAICFAVAALFSLILFTGGFRGFSFSLHSVMSVIISLICLTAMVLLTVALFIRNKGLVIAAAAVEICAAVIGLVFYLISDVADIIKYGMDSIDAFSVAYLVETVISQIFTALIYLFLLITALLSKKLNPAVNKVWMISGILAFLGAFVPIIFTIIISFMPNIKVYVSWQSVLNNIISVVIIPAAHILAGLWLKTDKSVSNGMF